MSIRRRAAVGVNVSVGLGMNKILNKSIFCTPAGCVQVYFRSHHRLMLRATPSWGQVLLHCLDPERCTVLYGEHAHEPWNHSHLTIHVDWSGHALPPSGTSQSHYVLSVRHRGAEVARHAALPGELLQTTIDWRIASPGECFVAVLEKDDEPLRHLHALRPLDSVRDVPLSHLLLTPSVAWPCDRVRTGRGGRQHTLPVCTIDRGLGLEVELLTPAPSAGRAESLLKSRGSKQEAWRAALEAAAESGEEPAELADRCALWEAGEDIYIFPSPQPIPWRMIEALEGQAGRRLSEDEKAALGDRMIFDGELGAAAHPSTHKTEFRAPLPPYELNFARRGTDEICCFARTAWRMGPTSAAALSPNYYSATSLHVHVNVRCPSSSGSLLSARELLAVWLEWVRFDGVTMRLARPWVWREPWCGPMFATGPELADPQANEPAWEQGGAAFEEEPHHSYDVPSFVRGVHAALRSALWHEHGRKGDEAGRVAFLFSSEYEGPFMPFKASLTRYCSLNLESIAKHGTLEMRRYNGTCDPLTIAHWAAFCVAFVETAKGSPSGLLQAVFDAPSASDGLEALRRAQETATPEELVTMMAGHLDPATIRYLLEDACPASAEVGVQVGAATTAATASSTHQAQGTSRSQAAGPRPSSSSSVKVESMPNLDAASRCLTM